MSTSPKPRRATPGERIRTARGERSLDAFADLIQREGAPRPSIAKLSRIETGVQPVPVDVLPAISKITGIPPRELRPDLAEMFRGRGAAA
jgi:hypothetical protein